MTPYYGSNISADKPGGNYGFFHERRGVITSSLHKYARWVLISHIGIFVVPVENDCDMVT